MLFRVTTCSCSQFFNNSFYFIGSDILYVLVRTYSNILYTVLTGASADVQPMESAGGGRVARGLRPRAIPQAQVVPRRPDGRRRRKANDKRLEWRPRAGRTERHVPAVADPCGGRHAGAASRIRHPGHRPARCTFRSSQSPKHSELSEHIKLDYCILYRVLCVCALCSCCSGGRDMARRWCRRAVSCRRL